MIWLLLLPFRLLFGVVFGLVALPFILLLLPFALLLWLPFAILRLTLKLAVGIVVLPILAIVMLLGLLVGGVAVAAAVLVPLIPLLVLGVLRLGRVAAGPGPRVRRRPLAVMRYFASVQSLRRFTPSLPVATAVLD